MFVFLFCSGREEANAAFCLLGTGAVSSGGPPLACSPRTVTVCGLHQEMLRSSYEVGGLDFHVNIELER